MAEDQVQVSCEGMSVDLTVIAEAVGTGLIADDFTIRTALPNSPVTTQELQDALDTYAAAQEQDSRSGLLDSIASIDTSKVGDVTVRAALNGLKRALTEVVTGPG